MNTNPTTLILDAITESLRALVRDVSRDHLASIRRDFEHTYTAHAAEVAALREQVASLSQHVSGLLGVTAQENAEMPDAVPVSEQLLDLRRRVDGLEQDFSVAESEASKLESRVDSLEDADERITDRDVQRRIEEALCDFDTDDITRDVQTRIVDTVREVVQDEVEKAMLSAREEIETACVERVESADVRERLANEVIGRVSLRLWATVPMGVKLSATAGGNNEGVPE